MVQYRVTEVALVYNNAILNQKCLIMNTEKTLELFYKKTFLLCSYLGYHYPYSITLAVVISLLTLC